MHDDIEREPCPRCGEPAAVAARVCPHCQGSLLVDVVLDRPVADSRVRYQLSRMLASLGPPAPDFSTSQKALASPTPVLARKVTREAARDLLGVLAEYGVQGRTALPGSASQGFGEFGEFGNFGGRRLMIAGGAAAALMLAASGFLLLRPDEAPDAAAAPVAAVERPAPQAPRTGDTRPSPQAKLGTPLTTRDLAEMATPATVVLRHGTSVGSGFFVDEDLVLTNAHVVGSAGDPVEAVFSDGRTLSGKAVRHDEWLDLALIRVDNAAVEPLPIGDAMALKTGDEVVFIGTPEGLEFTVHQGIVSHTARQNLGVAYFQVDANVNHGNSGGPVLDSLGRVVGIVTARVADAEGLGFVLPINYAYDGKTPLVERPEPGPDEQKWKTLLAQVEVADRQQADKIAAAASKPMLLKAAMAPRGKDLEIVAAVVRFSSYQPSPESLFFTFRKPGRMICSVTAPVEGWVQVRENVLGGNSRVQQWLEKKGLSQNLYQGNARLDLKECPADELQGSDMVLEGAEEGSNRIAIQ
jgi:serine protease Do